MRAGRHLGEMTPPMISRPRHVLRRLRDLLPPPRLESDETGANRQAAFEPTLAAPDPASALSLASWALRPTNRQPAAIHYFRSRTR